MRIPFSSRRPTFVLPGLVFLCGCFRITINPECPREIEEGQTGDLIAHEGTPGAIPTYLWEGDPAGRVELVDEDQPNATFEAIRSGQVVFTLTANDGLFQMVRSCTTTITEPGGGPPPDPEPEIVLLLVANPTEIVLGDEDPSVLLTCTNTGTTPATLIIDQLDGPPGSLTPVSPGTSVAVLPRQPATYTFRCLGTDAQGNRSDLATVRVIVSNGRPSPR